MSTDQPPPIPANHPINDNLRREHKSGTDEGLIELAEAGDKSAVSVITQIDGRCCKLFEGLERGRYGGRFVVEAGMGLE